MTEGSARSRMFAKYTVLHVCGVKFTNNLPFSQEKWEKSDFLINKKLWFCMQV